MITNDVKYEKMRRLCKKYYDEIEKLKNNVYGYTLSLNYISPQHEDLFAPPIETKFYGFDAFVDTITNYYKGFTKETAECFAVPATIDDIKLIRTMLICICSYLKYECDSSDYTFLGLTKILSSFLGSISEEKATNLKTSTFWIMYDDIENKNQFPEETQRAYTEFFNTFNYNRYSRIADGIFHSVRFFLFDNELDYLSDTVMRISTMDMLRETRNRLDNIYFNRQSRNFEGYDYE